MADNRLMPRFRRGDATAHPGRPAILAHCCNDLGAWGAGFVLAVSARWPQVRAAYAELRRQSGAAIPLGTVQLVAAEPGLWVANLIAQHGLRGPGNPVPLRYGALGQALSDLSVRAQRMGVQVVMPRIGCGLAGGDWARVEALVVAHLCSQGVPVTVYDPRDRS